MKSPGAAALRTMEAAGGLKVLDPAVAVVEIASKRILGRSATGGAWRRLWEGAWLGHSFHPLLSDFVEGPWMAASFLDLFGPDGSGPAAQRLLGFGLLVSLPCYVAGLADWRQARKAGDRRIGVIHLAAISVAMGLYASSYAARRRDRRQRAVTLGLVGGTVAMLDGYVGGHLSHVRGVALGGHQ
jgi:hypothetical protein